MNPYVAYQQQRSPGQPRIDTILLLYETIMERLEKARAAWRNSDRETAQKHLAACNLGITGLASGFDARGGEMAVNFLRLYEFVNHCLTSPSEARISAALRVLRPLYEAFLEIRPQALGLERSGAIAPLDRVRTFQARA